MSGRRTLRRVFVTFLSDFGLQDDFVGTCHGVIKSIAPEVEIIDVTHGISPQHVLQGALVLANTTPYMPAGVHLAVVDPGVGSSRRPLALQSGDGRLFVGPDNGLLVPAAERLGGIAAGHELANADYALDIVLPTFHGRAPFAPPAASGTRRSCSPPRLARRSGSASRPYEFSGIVYLTQGNPSLRLPFSGLFIDFCGFFLHSRYDPFGEDAIQRFVRG